MASLPVARSSPSTPASAEGYREDVLALSPRQGGGRELRPQPVVGLPEHVLLRRARAGDDGAFEALVRAHQDRAYATALRLTGNAHDAQDSVQEAFLQAWRALPDFRGDAGFSTWLTRIVINRCHNLRRSSRTVPAVLDDDLVGSTPGAEQVALDSVRENAVHDAVLALPFDHRAALVLHAFSGHSHAEIGRILGISEGAAKVRVHRARRALVDSLREWR